jgi:hypothetical protein
MQGCKDGTQFPALLSSTSAPSCLLPWLVTVTDASIALPRPGKKGEGGSEMRNFMPRRENRHELRSGGEGKNISSRALRQ